jgi:hypothetical protein
MDKSKKPILILGILFIAAVVVIGVMLLATPHQETFVLTEDDISLESVFWYASEEYSAENRDWAGMKIRVDGKVYPDSSESSPETIVYTYSCHYYINNVMIPYSAKYSVATDPLYANDEYLRNLPEIIGVRDEKLGLVDSSKSNDLKVCCAVYEIQDLLKSSNTFFVRRMASNELCFSEILVAESPQF